MVDLTAGTHMCSFYFIMERQILHGNNMSLALEALLK